MDVIQRLINLDPNIVNVECSRYSYTYNSITPLILAVRWDRIDMVKLLLDNGANIEAKGAGLHSALHWSAINNRDINFDKLLIKRGCKLDIISYEGRTALICASKKFNIDRIKLLILADCNTKLKDEYGNTFMDYINKNEQNSKYISEINRLIEFRRTLLLRCVNYVKKNRSKFDSNSLKSLNKDIRQLL